MSSVCLALARPPSALVTLRAARVCGQGRLPGKESARPSCATLSPRPRLWLAWRAAATLAWSPASEGPNRLLPPAPGHELCPCCLTSAGTSTPAPVGAALPPACWVPCLPWGPGPSWLLCLAPIVKKTAPRGGFINTEAEVAFCCSVCPSWGPPCWEGKAGPPLQRAWDGMGWGGVGWELCDARGKRAGGSTGASGAGSLPSGTAPL